jgi:hypothetical protein
MTHIVTGRDTGSPHADVRFASNARTDGIRRNLNRHNASQQRAHEADFGMNASLHQSRAQTHRQ